MDVGHDRSWLKALGIVGIPGIVMLTCIGGGAVLGALIAGGRLWPLAGGALGAVAGLAAVYSLIGKVLK